MNQIENNLIARVRKAEADCKELLEALEAADAVIDELFPGVPNIVCDIGLINDGCIKMNRALAKAHRGQDK